MSEGNGSKKLPSGISIRKYPHAHLYRVRVQYEGRTHECGEFKSLRLAKLALDRYQAEAVLGTFKSPAQQRRERAAREALAETEKLTVAEWSEQWLELLETGNIDTMDPKPRSAGTLTAYRSTLRVHVLPVIGDKSLTLVTSDDLTGLVAAARTSGPGAARSVARTVSSLFSAAVAHKVPGMETNPFPKDLTPPKSRKRTANEIPTLTEVNAMAALMGEYGLGVHLAAWCQLRQGELLGLQRRDFTDLEDPDKAMLHIQRQWASKMSPPGYAQPKDDSVRSIAIPPALVPRIREHLNDHVLADPQAPMFPSPVDKARPISHNAFMRRWNKARQGVHPGLQFHTLRHFGLTVYAQAGATTAETMARGGHRDQEAAARYQHAVSTRDRQLAKAMSQMIEGTNE